jgi:hypothetical protein
MFFHFFFIFSFLIGFIRINWNKDYFPITTKKILVLITISILWSTWNYYQKISFEYKKELTHDGLKLAKLIEKYSESKQQMKYFILFDTSLEIPLDVYFFRKNQIWNDNQLKFYFTDWDFYGISKTLNQKEILKYYINKINTIKPKLIFVNQNNLQLGQSRMLAVRINNDLKNHISNNSNYHYKDKFIYNHQLISVFMLK